MPTGILARFRKQYNIPGTQSSGMDWLLVLAILPILAASLVTMHSFTGDSSYAAHQFIVIAVSFAAFFVVYRLDARILRSTWFSVSFYSVSLALLLLLSVLGKVSHGAQSWFTIAGLSFQPSDFAKLALLIILAKYFSRRHIEIANIKHIIISGIYAFVFFAIVLTNPDLGSAMMMFLIWLGMVMVSGISKKHLLAMIAVVAIVFALLWNFGFREYQKDRIRNFINPLADIRGAGYNAYQSTIAVGSGELWGKGLGYGTQSRLKFLPEYQTDFIFAAFSEEWGFAGVVILFTLYGVIIWRVIANALRGATNFEVLYGAGLAIFFIVHIAVNVGMNIHLLPVTGTPLPLMSYGGTHILVEFIALGILMSMRRYGIDVRRGAGNDS